MPVPVSGVLETVLYFNSEQETMTFYTETMGMRLIGHEPGRHMFFRAGSDLFLLFNAEATMQKGSLPAHGAQGSGHVCFRVPSSGFEQWRDHLASCGVEIIQQVEWPLGSPPGQGIGSSFYFRDPSGNLLEIADGDFWQK